VGSVIAGRQRHKASFSRLHQNQTENDKPVNSFASPLLEMSRKMPPGWELDSGTRFYHGFPQVA
jgi:hypothetical protein